MVRLWQTIIFCILAWISGALFSANLRLWDVGVRSSPKTILSRLRVSRWAVLVFFVVSSSVTSIAASYIFLRVDGARGGVTARDARLSFNADPGG